MNFIKKIPTPICGVILGLFGLGNLLQSYSEGIRMVCGIAATVLMVLFIISVCINPARFQKEMKTPIVASVFCTFPMALMLFATYFKPYLGAGPMKLVWVLAIALHVCMIVYFSLNFVAKFSLEKVFASWYIVFVGIAMASMTAPAFEATGIGTVCFWFGFASLIVLLVVVSKRYLKLPAPNPAQPLICIYAAPTSLCIAGYIQSVTPKSLPFLTVLWVLATVLFVFACIKFVQFLKLPFFPSYAAFTFPFVISAIASKQLMNCAAKLESPMPFLKPIVLIETIIATGTTLYALVKYLIFLSAPEKKD